MATGDYSDRNEYTLKVFGSKNIAQKFAETIRSQLDNLGCHTHGNYDADSRKRVIKLNGYTIDQNGASIRVDGPFPFEG
jgi:hypothetical protein